MSSRSGSQRAVLVALTLVGLVALSALGFAVHSSLSPSADSAKLTAATTPVIVNTVSAGPNTLTVVGNGQVNATPDQINLSLGVSATRATVPGALAAANVDMNRLLAALHNAGVADPDVQTAYFSIGLSACYQCPPGYQASNSVSVTVHHIGNAGPVVAAAVAAVGGDLNLNGSSPTLADDSSQLRDARVLAIADAHTRAQQWAAQTGRQLGGILSISEVIGNQAQASCSSGCGAGGASGGVPIAAGQTTVAVSVTVVYQLK